LCPVGTYSHTYITRYNPDYPKIATGATDSSGNKLYLKDNSNNEVVDTLLESYLTDPGDVSTTTKSNTKITETGAYQIVKAKTIPYEWFLTPCPLCKAGFYCDETGTTGITLKACPVGYYCPEGSKEPRACPPGTYNPDTHRMSIYECRLCPFGKYCETEGSI